MNKELNVGIIEDYILTNRLTIKEFCRQCNISISTFYRIMHGKDFYLISLFKIAKSMNIRLCRFF